MLLNRLLGIVSTPSCIECLEGISKKCQTLFKEKGWSEFTAEPSLVELTVLLLDLCKNITNKNSQEFFETLKTVSEKSTTKFESTRQFSLRIVYAKILIFSRIFLACFDFQTLSFRPIVKLPKSELDTLQAFLSSTLKPLVQTIKRKSTILTLRWALK